MTGASTDSFVKDRGCGDAAAPGAGDASVTTCRSEPTPEPSLTPKERELVERCTCDLARPYWHSFHREGCPLAR